ncbi:MgtC/SapB family protein [Paenibacillus sp. GCM10027626]|uniref:MgtC/SapB family protein n=1 Tax=Paenibacillus sp. GCM10027626 TaxID=3273411 RepID=UPI003627789D
MELVYLLRVVVAGIFGALIGYERKNRKKEAGIRTHFVVAVGASLMMIVSKYGFIDQIHWENLSLDPSRVAAQVVSGVGFLGAGMIFMQRNTVKGLTTAAGIWATAGMGMAIGSGLYWVGGGVTLIIVIAQIVLHGRIYSLATPKTEQLLIRFHDEPGVMTRIQQLIKAEQITILSFHAETSSQPADEIELEMAIQLPRSYGREQLLPIIQDVESVVSVEIQ